MDLLNTRRTSARRTTWLATALTGLSVACVPDLDNNESTITAPKVIAVVSEPAEATPGQSVAYGLLYANPGTGSEKSLAWYFCNAPKPLAELGPINQDCLSGSSGALNSIGDGSQTDATIPTDVCSVFGPNPPIPEDGTTPGRPTDPDATGGYLQPVMLAVGTPSVGEDILLYEQRVFCGLPNVTPQVSAEYNLQYKKNWNPALSGLQITHADGSTQQLVSGDSFQAQTGEVITLNVQWDACPATPVCGDGICSVGETFVDCPEDCTDPKGCTGQELFVYYNQSTAELENLWEGMRVSWYTTAGTYENERSSVKTPETGDEDQWTAPTEAGTVTLWIVIRDSRGGVGYAQFTVEVS